MGGGCLLAGAGQEKEQRCGNQAEQKQSRDLQVNHVHRWVATGSMTYILDMYVSKGHPGQAPRYLSKLWSPWVSQEEE